MKQTDYAFCVAKIRANETRLLSDEFINKLAEAKDYDDAVRMLSEKHWMTSEETIVQAVARQSLELWELLKDSVPYKQDLELLCITNDYQNIKVAVKCLLTKQNARDYFVYPTTLNLDELVSSVKNLDFERFDKNFGECAFKAYDIATKTENGQLSDIIIDNAALTMLLSAAKKSKDKIFAQVCSFIADTANIRIALRCAKTNKDAAFIEEAVSECKNLDKKRLVECCKTGYDEVLKYLEITEYSQGVKIYSETPSLFDKWCDDEIIRIISNAKYTAFGFAPVCSYYYKKMTEIKCIRIILSAKLAGADATTVKERVRVLNV